MFKWLTNLYQAYQSEKEMKMWFAKKSLCQPCSTFCGDDLCKRVGCMNTDMRSNYLRIKLLVRRLDKLSKMVHSSQEEIVKFEENTFDPYKVEEVTTTAKVIELSQYRKK